MNYLFINLHDGHGSNPGEAEIATPACRTTRLFYPAGGKLSTACGEFQQEFAGFL
jgi:hypothetical protein